MPLFPAYVDLAKMEVLVVGGGRVATRKVQNLLKFTENITVVAPEITEELRGLVRERGLKLRRRKFVTTDLRGKDLVIVAVDDLRLQRRIFKLCEKRRILCNSVDSPEYCNFIFPSLIVRGEVVIGISTSGRAPALSRRLRELIERALPENLEEILKTVEGERSKGSKGEERQRRIMELVDKLLPLD
ncbi:precorrin-2 dehydrogenase/sirohydrochlorin ferrochelatase family protein [Hydrogenivirga sp.]